MATDIIIEKIRTHIRYLFYYTGENVETQAKTYFVSLESLYAEGVMPIFFLKLVLK